jgi:flavin prenyltransferase
MRIVIGISGASGTIYGIRLLEVLRANPEVETHLVMTEAAQANLAIETELKLAGIEALADHVYDCRDLAARISSGSFKTDGMIVAPCSVKTLSAIVHSYSNNLLTRSADVTLKERRRLVLLVRETPLHTGHCRLLLEASTMGAVIMPPVPAFYHRPKSIDDIVNQTVERVLDLFGIGNTCVGRWGSA